MGKAGHVYILSNPAMPGLVKVGLAIDVERRAAGLYSTGVPTPFTIEHSYPTSDRYRTETATHKALADFRHNDSREFFAATPQQAANGIEQVLDARGEPYKSYSFLQIELAEGIAAAEESQRVYEEAIAEQRAEQNRLTAIAVAKGAERRRAFKQKALVFGAIAVLFTSVGFGKYQLRQERLERYQAEKAAEYRQKRAAERAHKEYARANRIKPMVKLEETDAERKHRLAEQTKWAAEKIQLQDVN